MEAADKGDMTACFDLASNFGSDTKGYTKNYDAAMFYMEKVKIAPVYLNDPDRMFNALKQDAYIEEVFKHYELAAEKYVIALRYMVLNLPTEDWDYTFLKWMSGIKDMVETHAEFSTTD